MSQFLGCDSRGGALKVVLRLRSAPGARGMGHGAQGTGHGARGMEQRARGMETWEAMSISSVFGLIVQRIFVSLIVSFVLNIFRCYETKDFP